MSIANPANSAAPASANLASNDFGQNQPTITFQQASFAYGTKTVLEGVNGQVLPGKALALIGPNGSGKTTLLRALLNMVRISQGEVQILGYKPGKQPRGSMAYVPQASDLDPTFPVRVLEVVQMGFYPKLGFLKRPNKAIKRKSLETLAKVGLEDRAHDRFGELSGGQQQRVLVARCVAADPKIILLDEPFNGLDQPNREALLSIIREVKERGISVVVSTHDMVIAHEVCEQVALLAGKQIAFGPTAQVLRPEIIAQAYGGTNEYTLTGAIA